MATEQNDDRGKQLLFGLPSKPAGEEGQDAGSTEAVLGRTVVFPNVLQHRVAPFSLADKSKPGHRRILCFFLVDPGDSALATTRHVSPQQVDWMPHVESWEDRGAPLPEGVSPELVASVAPPRGGAARESAFAMTRRDAEAQRLRLMAERRPPETTAHDGRYVGPTFSGKYSLWYARQHLPPAPRAPPLAGRVASLYSRGLPSSQRALRRIARGVHCTAESRLLARRRQRSPGSVRLPVDRQVACRAAPALARWRRWKRRTEREGAKMRARLPDACAPLLAEEHALEEEDNKKATPRHGKLIITRRLLTAVAACTALAFNIRSLVTSVVLRTGVFREVVTESSPRQVLVLGTQSSGTTHTTELLQALGFEVAHENSNGLHKFCADGSVSWFHAVRLLPGRVSEASLDTLCNRSRKRSGFHPAMFREPVTCSPGWLARWDACWVSECRALLTATWGCARRPEGCATPYARTLVQSRHPLRVTESLTVKFCRDSASVPNPEVFDIIRALWPDHSALDYYGRNGPCHLAFAYYWVLYYGTLREAMASGAVDAFYPVENATACSVARLAGFASHDALRSTSHATFATACSQPQPQARRPSNKRNKGLFHLTRADIATADPALDRAVADLSRFMGYEYEAPGPGDDAPVAASRDGNEGVAGLPRKVRHRQAANDWSPEQAAAARS